MLHFSVKLTLLAILALASALSTAALSLVRFGRMLNMNKIGVMNYKHICPGHITYEYNLLNQPRLVTLNTGTVTYSDYRYCGKLVLISTTINGDEIETTATIVAYGSEMPNSANNMVYAALGLRSDIDFDFEWRMAQSLEDPGEGNKGG